MDTPAHHKIKKKIIQEVYLNLSDQVEVEPKLTVFLAMKNAVQGDGYNYVTLYNGEGLTNEGKIYANFFKKDNEKLILKEDDFTTKLNSDEINYDTLEFLNFDLGYWKDLCKLSKISICLCIGDTMAWKVVAKGNNRETDEAWNRKVNFLENNLMLSYYGNKSANIFLSCSSVEFANALNTLKWDYQLDGSNMWGNKSNIPCVGFDDLVFQYNSNIIFCRSYLESKKKQLIKDIKNLLSTVGDDDGTQLETYKNLLNNIERFGKEYPSMWKKKGGYPNTPYGKNIRKDVDYSHPGKNEISKNNSFHDKIYFFLNTFFRNYFIKESILNEIDYVNANKWRINYVKKILDSAHCNLCNSGDLEKIITEVVKQNGTHYSIMFRGVPFIVPPENQGSDFTEVGERVVVDFDCEKGIDKMIHNNSAEYEKNINYKIYVELLLANSTDNNREDFYTYLNNNINDFLVNPIFVIKNYLQSHQGFPLNNITASQYNLFANDNKEVEALDEISKYLNNNNNNIAQEMVPTQVIAKMNNTSLNNSTVYTLGEVKEYKVGGGRRKRRTCRKIRRKIRRRTKRKKRKSCRTRKKKHKRKSKRKNTRRKREKLVD